MESSVYKLLEHSWLYSLAQLVFAPGQVADITRLLRGLPESFHSGRTLDVGCGPASWLSRVGIRPVGLDLNVDYLKRLALADHPAIGGSADALPFADGSFDCATSIGVLHHLPDEIASAALREMVRVVRPGGQVYIFDNVFPEPFYRRPLPYAIRRLDRGRYVRTEERLRALVARAIPGPTDVRRVSYSWYGLEALTFLARR